MKTNKMIHRVALTTAVALMFAVSAVSVNAKVVVHDTFNHPNGNLDGQAPEVGGVWAAHSGRGHKLIQVKDGTISLKQSSGSGEDVHSNFAGGATASALGGEIYASFDLSVKGSKKGSKKKIKTTFFAHFLKSGSSFAAKVFVTSSKGSGYAIGLSSSSNKAQAKTHSLKFGKTYHVVTSYNTKTGEAKLWINPKNKTSASIAATSKKHYDVDGYAFRQARGNTVETISGLKVGTTFKDVK